MSVCVGEEESASEEPGAPLREAVEQKSVSKVVRVLTVLAYLLSVSLAAILLSVYYVCVWKSPDLPALNATEGAMERLQADRHLGAPETTAPAFSNIHGGSGVTVDETLSSTTSADIASDTSETTSDSSPSSKPPYLSTEPLTHPLNSTATAAVNNSSVT